MSPRVQYPFFLSDMAYGQVDYTTERGTTVSYSVALIASHHGSWHTVRVDDNAHGPHDMHRHTLSGGKQPAQRFQHGTASEAFNAALAAIRGGYEEMIAGWLR
jgi:hypothetical protein